MKLIITRHGETEENVRGVIQGHLQGVLTEKGIEQAKQLGILLKDETIDYIYSSDLARCVDTAREIIKLHKDSPVEYTKELREIYLGKWQGKTKQEIGYSSNKSLGMNVPVDGETLEELFIRATNLLRFLLGKHVNDTVLLVGHKKINNALISVIEGKDIGEMMSMKYQDNAGIKVVEVSKDLLIKI